MNRHLAKFSWRYIYWIIQTEKCTNDEWYGLMNFSQTEYTCVITTQIKKQNITCISLCAPFVHYPSTPRVTTILNSNTVYQFCLFLNIYMWKHKVYILFCLASFAQHCLWDPSESLHVVIIHSFSLLFCILLFKCTAIWLSILLLVNMWIVFQFSAITNSAAVNILLHAF